MLKPVRNVVTKKTIATHIVSLFSPDSAFFCEENICEAPPIDAMPSPLGEWINTNTISNKADIICTIQRNVNIYNSFLITDLSLFYHKRFLILQCSCRQ